MQTVSITTPPTNPPVSTNDFKAHLRVNDSSEDSLLAGWILAASDLFTKTTGYVLMSTTFKLHLDGWPYGGVIYVPRAPVTDIGLVEYLDDDGVWQEFEDWTADTISTPARITLSTTLPTLNVYQVPNVRVTFAAGHANAAACPPLAVQGVKVLAAHYYAQREAFGEANLSEVPKGWSAITSMFDTGVRGVWNE